MSGRFVSLAVSFDGEKFSPAESRTGVDVIAIPEERSLSEKEPFDDEYSTKEEALYVDFEDSEQESSEEYETSKKLEEDEEVLYVNFEESLS